MISGRFNVTKMACPGLSDEDFARAREEGRLSELLDGLSVVDQCHAVSNRLFDNLAGYLLDHLFSLGNCGFPYYFGGASAAALGFICLMSSDSETSNYEEHWGTDFPASPYSIHRADQSVNTSSGAKRFEEDQIEDWVIWMDPDREAVHFKNRWLYLPTQGISSDIKSVGIHYHEDGDGTGAYGIAQGRLGRARLKDADGNHITLTKNINEVLLIEYQYTLVSM